MGRLESFAAALSGGVEGYIQSKKQVREQEESKLKQKLVESQISKFEEELMEKGRKREEEERYQAQIGPLLEKEPGLTELERGFLRRAPAKEGLEYLEGKRAKLKPAGPMVLGEGQRLVDPVTRETIIPAITKPTEPKEEFRSQRDLETKATFGDPRARAVIAGQEQRRGVRFQQQLQARLLTDDKSMALQESLGKVNDIVARFDAPDSDVAQIMGPKAGRLAPYRETLGDVPILGRAVGGPLSANQIAFLKELNSWRNDVTKGRAGSAMTATELARVETELTNIDRGATSFKDGIKAIQGTLQRAQQRRVDAIKLQTSLTNFEPSVPKDFDEVPAR